MAIFALFGAFDRIIGNKLGIGNEFEKGIRLLGEMALSMVGMIVLSPLLAACMAPLTKHLTGMLDPSTLPAIFFANDMGGAPLSVEMANNELLGKFNGLIVSSMMGATISFSVPYAIGVVAKEKQKNMFLGFLCGIVTIPVGCFIGGLMLKVPFFPLVVNLLPLIILAGLIVFGLLKFPNVCIKIFLVIGIIIKILVTVGLAVGIFEALTDIKLIPGTDHLNAGIQVIVNASCVMAGAFPLINLLSKLLKRPLTFFGKKLGISPISAMGLISTMATNVTTFGIMNKMDEKGIVLNSAFAVSGAFVFAGHLAFTLAFSPDCLFAMIVGKLIAGVLSVLVALFIFKRQKKACA